MVQLFPFDLYSLSSEPLWPIALWLTFKSALKLFPPRSLERSELFQSEDCSAPEQISGSYLQVIDCTERGGKDEVRQPETLAPRQGRIIPVPLQAELMP